MDDNQSSNYNNNVLASEDHKQNCLRSKLYDDIKKDRNDYDNNNNNDNNSDNEVGYDEAIRYILSPLWFAIRNSLHLELGVAISSLIVEVINIVHEHIEKSTYGKYHLRSTILTWQVLIRQ